MEVANQVFLAGCNGLETAYLLPVVIYQRATTGPEGSKPRYGASEIQLQLQGSLIGINNQDLLLKDTNF